MANLQNSTRISFKATYVPSTIQPQERPQTGRALEKVAFLRGLDITPEELQRLRETGQAAPGLLDLVGRVADDSVAAIGRFGPAVAAVPVDNLSWRARESRPIRPVRPSPCRVLRTERLRYCLVQPANQHAVTCEHSMAVTLGSALWAGSY